MVGWHLLLLLTVEAALYGAIGRHAYVAWGWSTGDSIALAVGIYLWLRIFLVGLEFVLARWKGVSIPEASAVSSPRCIAMYFRELGGWLLMFSLILPFVPARRSVIDRLPQEGAPAGLPILLVHGLACNRGNWFWFRRQLENRGYRVFTVDYTPWYAKIDRYPPQLARAIDEVLSHEGTRQLIVIGHSMGGLVARAYLDRFGEDKVAHVITLGTPHRGTWMARFGYSPNIRDMAEASDWLVSLERRERKRAEDPYSRFTCIFTYHDNLVTPQRNATLPGAEEVSVSGVGHLSLALSPTVLDAVSTVLGRPFDGSTK
jgi:pimeloyl-ACP methyl ester carboxylesterase